jgi:hypothetical protein
VHGHQHLQDVLLQAGRRERPAGHRRTRPALDLGELLRPLPVPRLLVELLLARLVPLSEFLVLLLPGFRRRRSALRRGGRRGGRGVDPLALLAGRRGVRLVRNALLVHPAVCRRAEYRRRDKEREDEERTPLHFAECLLMVSIGTG